MNRLLVVFYRALLNLLPVDFRDDHGSEMAVIFADRLQSCGGIRKVGVFGRSAAAVLRVAVQERLRPSVPRRPDQSNRGSVFDEVTGAFRTVRRRPGMAAVVGVMLGGGIGLSTTMFAVASGFVADLPFEDGDRYVHFILRQAEIGSEVPRFEMSDLEGLDDRELGLDWVAAYSSVEVAVSVRDEVPARYSGAKISPEAFARFGVSAIHGRGLGAIDAVGEPSVVVISEALWERLFQSDPDVLGSELRIGSEVASVVGVMPRGFGFPSNASWWMPIKEEHAQNISIFGKLGDDGSHEAIAAAAHALVANRAQSEGRFDLQVVPFTHRFVNETATPLFALMLAVTLGVLAVACVNAANLLLVWALSRARELALRSAVGASTGRIVRQLLLEAGFMALVGLLLGLAIAYLASVGIERAVAVAEMPFWISFGIDPRVFLFAAIVSVGSAVAAGVLPARRVARRDLNSHLNDEARGVAGMKLGRASRILVGAELALAMGLLIPAAFLGDRIASVALYDPPYLTDEVLTARISLGRVDDLGRLGLVSEQIVTELAALPTVSAASRTQQLPGVLGPMSVYEREGDSYDRVAALPRAQLTGVSRGFLETFGIDLTAGRDFLTSDFTGESGVAIITRSFADSAFGSSGAIGEQIRFHFPNDDLQQATQRAWRTVIGVVPDLTTPGGVVAQSTSLAAFVPERGASNYFYVGLRASSGTAGDVADDLRRVVAGVDREAVVSQVHSMNFIASRHAMMYASAGTAFVVSGGAAFMLALIGLFTVISFTGRSRQYEFGIRLALGSSRARVITMVLRDSTWQILCGLAVGVIIAFGVSVGLEAMLLELNPAARDWARVGPAYYVSVGLLLALTGLLAGSVPALRAARTDPVEAFRST